MSGWLIGLLSGLAYMGAMYLLNIPVRMWKMRRMRTVNGDGVLFPVHRPQQDVQPLFGHVFLFMLPVVGVQTLGAGLHSYPAELVQALFVSFAVSIGLMQIYRRSFTATYDLVWIDRKGIALFPQRNTWLGGGTFLSQILWKDCFGYSIYKGHLLFSLIPFAHVEQAYGPHRAEMEKVLNSLGIQKLVSYDMMAQEEATAADLEQLEERVLAMVQDVIRGHGAACDELGIRITAERMYGQEQADADDAFAFLRLSMWVDDECEQDIDWLLWALYGDSVEMLGLTDDRLYESLDDRVHALMERRMAAVGKEEKRTVLQ